MKYIIFVTLTMSAFLLPSTTSVRNKDLEFSDTEKLALEKLRPLVRGINYDDWIKEDWSLIHYIRIKNLDVNSAAGAIKETTRWRKENRIDSIEVENIIELRPPFNVDSTAKNGSPVVIWAPARWDIRQNLLEGKRAKLVRYVDQMLETTFSRIRKIRAQGGNVTQWVHILDLHGYNLRQHACATCFPVYLEWVSHLENHYPAAHQHMIYINTPRIFQPLLSILKAAYSAPTRNALRVFGVDKSEWQAELMKLIAPEELPKFLGGRKLNWF